MGRVLKRDKKSESESHLTKKLKEAVRNSCGLFIKLSDRYHTGYPDVIVIHPGGQVDFLEIKAENGTLGRLQEYYGKEIIKRGGSWFEIRGLKGVKKYLELRKIEE